MLWLHRSFPAAATLPLLTKLVILCGPAAAIFTSPQTKLIIFCGPAAHTLPFLRLNWLYCVVQQQLPFTSPHTKLVILCGPTAATFTSPHTKLVILCGPAAATFTSPHTKLVILCGPTTATLPLITANYHVSAKHNLLKTSPLLLSLLLYLFI